MTEPTPLERMKRAITPFDVYVKEASAQVAADYDARYPEQNITFQIRHGLRGETESFDISEEGSEDRMRILRYVVETAIRFVDETSTSREEAPSEKSEPVVRAEITATWIVEYRVLKPEEVDEEGVQAFSENNVMYHVWPYWREFIHATCARLRLPQVVLPTYRMRRKDEPPQTSSHAETVGAEVKR